MEVNQERFVKQMTALLNEKQRRIFLGAYADLLGYGGISALSSLTGVSRTTIKKGQDEYNGIPATEQAEADSASNVQADDRTDVQTDDSVSPDFSTAIRAPGGGRKSIREKYPTIYDDFYSIMSGNTPETPGCPFYWTTRSYRELVEDLKSQKNIEVSYQIIPELLSKLELSSSAESHKKVELESFNSQYHFIYQLIRQADKYGAPVLLMNDNNDAFIDLIPVIMNRFQFFWNTEIKENIIEKKNSYTDLVLIVKRTPYTHFSTQFDKSMYKFAVENKLVIHISYLPEGGMMQWKNSLPLLFSYNVKYESKNTEKPQGFFSMSLISPGKKKAANPLISNTSPKYTGRRHDYLNYIIDPRSYTKLWTSNLHNNTIEIQ